jgi:hypothetical protein
MPSMNREQIAALLNETVTLNGQPAKVVEGGSFAVITAGETTGKWAWPHAQDIIDRGGLFKV